MDKLLTLLLIFPAALLARWLYRRVFARGPFAALPGPRPQSWLTGNLKQLFNAKGLPFHEHLSSVYGGMVRVYGFFGDEQLYVSDPHAIAAILGKDSRGEEGCFDETEVFLECNKLIFGPGLVSTTGDLHKRQKKLALPMFSTAQLGRVTEVFYDVAEKLAKVLQDEVTEAQEEGLDRKSEATLEGVLDMNEWSSRVSLEAAGQAILGYSFDPLDSRVANPYTSAVKELIPTLFSLALIRNFFPFLVKLGPPFFRRWLVERIPSRRVWKVVESSDVMDESARQILAERRRSLALTNNSEVGEGEMGETGRSKGIISTLLHANSLASPMDRMTDVELTGQMTVLIFGASDTTSSALSRIFWLLAQNEEVQGKVRDEIREAYASMKDQVDNGGDAKAAEEGKRRLDADIIMKLPWLDAVIKETLRMYPPVPFVRRVCTRSTTIPYACPSSSDCREHGELATVHIPKGTTLFLSVLGFNRNEAVWGEDAGVWKPERWLCDAGSGDGGGTTKKPSNENVKVPGAFLGMLSFLGGGRSCVGSRFAIIEIKIILATVLSKMYFKPTNEEVVWNLSQIISPSVRRTSTTVEDGKEIVSEVETKGLPLIAVLEDLTV